MHNSLRVQPFGTRSRRQEAAAVRIAVLVTDTHLAEAVVAALAALWSVFVLPNDPAPLEASDWDVCVVEAGFAGAALEARHGRGLVILTGASGPPPVAAPVGSGAGAVVLLRVPCTLDRLREAVHAAAGVGQAGEGPSVAS
jgi:hypothetical protein